MILNDELEIMCKEATEVWLRYYPSICLEKLRKITHLLIQTRLIPLECGMEPP